MQKQAVLQRRKKLFSFVSYTRDMFYHNTYEQLIEEILNGDIIQGTYEQSQKKFHFRISRR